MSIESARRRDPVRAKATIAGAKAFIWCNEASQWDGRATDLETMYRDKAGAKDARDIAAAIRAAAERLVERTR